DKAMTLVYSPAERRFQIINNENEALSGQLPSSGTLPEASDDFVILDDNDTVFAAVRNAPVSGQPSGAVVALDISEGTITHTIPAVHVRRLALSPNNDRLLAFPDDLNSFWIIDTAA